MMIPHAPTPEHAPVPKSACVATNGRTLLLVDDEAPIRSALRRFFTRRGWTVTEAADGEHARALLLDCPTTGGGYDAIISDMHMPRLSGLALHELVAQRSGSVARRFIFSSGDCGDEVSAAYIARAHCTVLLKPFDLPRLLALVEAMPTQDDQLN